MGGSQVSGSLTEAPRSDYGEAGESPSFDEVWAEVRENVTARLRRRGVDAWDAADFAQEAGLRALDRGVEYTDAGDLTRWVGVVAWRLAVDARRKDRLVDAGELPQTAAVGSVESTVEGRMDLRVVRTAWGALAAGDQEAIRGGVNSEPGPPDRKTAVRLAVRRHRARQRLLALIEGLVAWVWLWGSRPSPARKVLAAAAVTPVAMGLLVLSGPTSAEEPVVPPVVFEVEGRPGLTFAEVARHADDLDLTGSQAPAAPGTPLGTKPGPSPDDAADPIAEVLVPGVGGSGRTTVREKQEGDHLLCADTIAAGWHCSDLPDLAELGHEE